MAYCGYTEEEIREWITKYQGKKLPPGVEEAYCRMANALAARFQRETEIAEEIAARRKNAHLRDY